MRVDGDLKNAGLERLSSDPSVLWEGRTWFNTTDKVAKVYRDSTISVLNNEEILGISIGDTDMGAYTGTVLTDSTTAKANIQELGVQVDTNVTEIANVKTQSGGLSSGTNPALVSGWNTVDSVSIYAPTGDIFLSGQYAVSGSTSFDIRWVIDSDVAPTDSFNGTDSGGASVAVAGTSYCYWSASAGTHTVKLQFKLVGNYVGTNHAIATVVGG